ncbi:MAG: DegT/DnrJ/EryC1/StrS family aminotransferase [Flavobacteriales bacterium]|nr:DegT/DnrJ/EryC1/StrS family aminotransferase [Flavobacteriales bacterium]
MTEGPIHVTRTFLPPLAEYEALLREVWATGQVTNNGALLRRLEEELAPHLGMAHGLFVGNGTIALQLALRALDITGEVITTPFSYVASTSAILWEHATPVFADIDPITFNIDPARIEALITPRTQAILATHVYGLPCAVETIKAISRKHQIKVIYDGAHAFGTMYRGRPLLSYGDISTCSFHATKLFHSGEGGSISTHDEEVYKRLRLLRAFGHMGDEHYTLGINGKNSELHAAMGLAVLKYIDAIKTRRREQWLRYAALLQGSPVRLATIPADTQYNHSYFPVVFASEAELTRMLEALAAIDVHPRRYFHPSLTTLPYVDQRGSCPVAEDIAPRVLCLPLFHDLGSDDQERIVKVMTRTLKA